MREQYKRDGYVVVDNVIDLAGLQPSKTLMHEGALQRMRVSEDEYRKVCRAMAQDVYVMALFTQKLIREVVARLGVHAQLFLTNPVAHIMGADLWHEGVGAHQDWPALQSGLDTIVAWIPLFDVGLDDYPLEVVPGSHLRGLLPSKAGEHINEIDTTGMEFVPVTMKRGDVLLFSAFTVHRTRTPGTGFRAAFSHRYENLLDVSFQDRGFYSAQRRVIDREVKWTPTPEQVREVFA